ncbi:MAG TPA: HEAT repeat domain-containing protein, partial [Candidatus Bathyarchaeia archaeon]|nr:HEAT repeat domain-containing protein [Candidatus Bathyarchaeia archaeon]
MIAKLSSPDEMVRLEAAEKFNDYNYFGQAEVIEALRLRLADENPAVRRAALEALGTIAVGHQEAAEAVFAVIASEKNSDVLKQAVRTFGEIASQTGERQVMAMVDLYNQTKDEGLKWCIRDAVIKIGFANDRVIDLLKDAKSFDGLKKLGAGNARAMTALAELARSSEWHVHYYVLEALADFERGEADATQALKILYEVYKNDTDKYGKRRHQIMIAAQHIGVGNSAATGIFIDGLDDAVRDVVYASIGGLGSQDYSSQEDARKAVDALIELQYQTGSGIEAIADFGRDFPYARQALLKNLGRFEQLKGENRRWRLADYLEVLGLVSLENDAQVEAILLKALQDKDVLVSSAAVRGLAGPAQRNNKTVAQTVIARIRSLGQDFRYFGHYYLEILARIAPDVAETQEFLKEVALNERNGKDLREQAARLLADIQNRDKVKVNTVRSFQDILAPAQETQTQHSHRVFLNEKGDLFVFDYRDVQSMAAAQNLFAAFAERKGLTGKVLSRAQRARLNQAFYAGHNYPIEKIAETLHAYHQAGVKLKDLTGAQQKFIHDLMMIGMISYDESSGYTVLQPGVYIISITQDSKQREEVLRHEAIHALMELDPDFRAQVEQRWNNLTEGE